MATALNHLPNLTRPRSTAIIRMQHAEQQAAPTGYYHRIEGFAKRIRATRNVRQIVELLDEALRATRTPGDDTAALALAEERIRRAEREIATLKEQLSKAIDLTNLDPLTGLLNRRGLEAGLTAEAARSDRHGAPLCIALLDIDDFKRINDVHGHAAGDAALTHLAKLMRSTLRPNDILARVGGEEFIVLLPDSNEQAAFAALHRLLQTVTDHAIVCSRHTLSLSFTASVTLRALGERQKQIENRLDKALYTAKRAGKKRVMFALAD